MPKLGLSEDLVGRLAVLQAVRIWDLATSCEVVHLRRGDSARSVAFSPDGGWLAAGRDGTTASLSEVVSSSEFIRVAQLARAGGIAFRSDGSLLATQYAYGSARMWSVEAQTAQRVITGEGVGYASRDSAACSAQAAPTGAPPPPATANGGNATNGELAPGKAQIFEACPASSRVGAEPRGAPGLGRQRLSCELGARSRKWERAEQPGRTGECAYGAMPDQ